jgi:hypothetical protein
MGFKGVQIDEETIEKMKQTGGMKSMKMVMFSSS